MNFDQAFEKLIGHEGGYVNDTRDPGGETKFGISKRSYPAENIALLTLERAKEIYRRDFWGVADSMPDPVKYSVFDVAVNSGASRAIKLLQKSVGEVEDGKMGPLTLQAINSMNPFRLAARFEGHRLEFLAGQPTWDRFGEGWSRRVASNLEQL